jgi:pimeloyl-ACP methyl ester carboxylesterase
VTISPSNNRAGDRHGDSGERRGDPLDADVAARRFPEAGGRLCVFIHGLGCDEHGWDPGYDAADSETHFGRQLSAEFACTPLYLRYNSGLPIADNGAQLAALLEELLAAWPQPASDLLIIGHSMGGLIALAACEQAAAGHALAAARRGC